MNLGRRAVGRKFRETNWFCPASILRYTCRRGEQSRKSSIFILVLYNRGVSRVTGKRTFAVGGYS